jgi:transposase-like protein
MTLPPYLEQIIGRNDKVYLLFESASHLYRQKAGIMHMDRIIKIKIEDIYKK